MKNTFVILLFLSFLVRDHAQNARRAKNSDPLKFEVNHLSDYLVDPTFKITFELPECPYNKSSAQKDIEIDSMSIIIHGGFAGFGNMDENVSAEFQRKYRVAFVYVGCARYWNPASEDTHGYNEIIFAQLEKMYGSVVHTEFKQLWIDNT